MTIDDLRRHIANAVAPYDDRGRFILAVQFLCAENDKRKEEIAALQDAVRSAAVHEHRLPTPNS